MCALCVSVLLLDVRHKRARPRKPTGARSRRVYANNSYNELARYRPLTSRTSEARNNAHTCIHPLHTAHTVHAQLPPPATRRSQNHTSTTHVVRIARIVSLSDLQRSLGLCACVPAYMLASHMRRCTSVCVCGSRARALVRSLGVERYYVFAGW